MSLIVRRASALEHSYILIFICIQCRFLISIHKSLNYLFREINDGVRAKPVQIVFAFIQKLLFTWSNFSEESPIQHKCEIHSLLISYLRMLDRSHIERRLDRTVSKRMISRNCLFFFFFRLLITRRRFGEKWLRRRTSTDAADHSHSFAGSIALVSVSFLITWMHFSGEHSCAGSNVSEVSWKKNAESLVGVWAAISGLRESK